MGNAAIIQVISNALKQSGITSIALSRKTGIPYARLNRIIRCECELRAHEFIVLIFVLNLDFKIFKPNKEED